MKKIAFINVVCNGSTGNIMCDIATSLKNENFDTYVFYGRGKGREDLNSIKIGNKLSILFHVLLARLGFNGHGSYFATKKFIKKLKKINPDIIHMHNIHGYYLNLKLLFKYLKNEYKGKVVWTLHDCWSFTGHCSYFTCVNCNKWESICNKCPQLNSYPKEYFDTTKKEFEFKKKLFTSIDDVILITPSKWLKDLVNRSFLNKYDTRVVNNGIDLNIFKKDNDNSIMNKYNIPNDKRIILGVANIWEERKGLNIFLELSKIIKNDEVIVLVGLNDKQISLLPNNIIGIKRTDNKNDLVKLYSIANVFLNPSMEETFSMVTVESLACGTPVIVNNMSAPKELIDLKVGEIVNDNNVNSYYNALRRVINKKVSSDYANKYSLNNMLDYYYEIYKELL